MGDHTHFYHTPARAARVAAQEFKKRSETDIHIEWDLPKLDDYLIPMIPGDLVSILGRPGHGKTSALIHLARTVALRLKDQEGLVVYATWETLVEEFIGVLTSGESGQSLEDIGRGVADLGRVNDAMVKVVGSRIAVVGRSRESPSDRFHTLQDLDSILKELTGVRLVLIDYLQRIPGLRGQDRAERVRENLEMINDMALTRLVPIALAVQSRRDVDEYSGLRLPGLNDGAWAANIEQTSDKVFGVTRPCLYMDEGRKIKREGIIYEVGPATFCLKVLKQRWGKAGDTFILGFEPRFARLYEMSGSTEEEEPEEMLF